MAQKSTAPERSLYTFTGETVEHHNTSRLESALEQMFLGINQAANNQLLSPLSDVTAQEKQEITAKVNSEPGFLPALTIQAIAEASQKSDILQKGTEGIPSLLDQGKKFVERQIADELAKAKREPIGSRESEEMHHDLGPFTMKMIPNTIPDNIERDMMRAMAKKDAIRAEWKGDPKKYHDYAIRAYADSVSTLSKGFLQLTPERQVELLALCQVHGFMVEVFTEPNGRTHPFYKQMVLTLQGELGKVVPNLTDVFDQTKFAALTSLHTRKQLQDTNEDQRLGILGRTRQRAALMISPKNKVQGHPGGVRGAYKQLMHSAPRAALMEILPHYLFDAEASKNLLLALNQYFEVGNLQDNKVQGYLRPVKQHIIRAMSTAGEAFYSFWNTAPSASIEEWIGWYQKNNVMPINTPERHTAQAKKLIATFVNGILRKQSAGKNSSWYTEAVSLPATSSSPEKIAEAVFTEVSAEK